MRVTNVIVQDLNISQSCVVYSQKKYLMYSYMYLHKPYDFIICIIDIKILEKKNQVAWQKPFNFELKIIFDSR